MYRQQVDTHEILRAEAVAELSPQMGYAEGYSDEPIRLDSWEKLPDSRIQNGEFKFNIMMQGVTRAQAIGSKRNIANIISISIQQFAMPILSEVPYGSGSTITSGTLIFAQNNTNTETYPQANVPTLVQDAPATSTDPAVGQYPIQSLTTSAASVVGKYAYPWLNNPYTQIPFGNEFTILIKELSSQGIPGSNGSFYHFPLFLSPLGILGANPNMLQALPKHGGETIMFTDPIQDLPSVTLVFRNPDIPISFDPDIFYNIKMLIDPDSYFVCFYYPNHKLCAGDRIYIRDLVVPDNVPGTYQSVYNELRVAVTRNSGWVVNGGGSTSLYNANNYNAGELIPGDYFYTDRAIDLSNNPTFVTYYNANLQYPNVFIAKRRLQVIVTFRCIVKRQTNHVLMPGVGSVPRRNETMYRGRF